MTLSPDVIAALGLSRSDASSGGADWIFSVAVAAAVRDVELDRHGLAASPSPDPARQPVPQQRLGRLLPPQRPSRRSPRHVPVREPLHGPVSIPPQLLAFAADDT